MSIDLSGVLVDLLEGAIGTARRLVDLQNWAKAASSYARAAKLMKQYAMSATSSEVKKKRLAEAEKLQTYADQLRNGKKPGVQNGVTIPADNQTIAGEKGNYIENARGLIKQAKVGWNDIAGLDDVKKFVKESYALSFAKRPAEMGVSKAANLLLYGPPGTGKTLIAAAVSKGLEATFFSCKISDMLSKYFGESSRLVNAIFELAEQSSPAVIFLDDFESLVANRDSDSNGAERRVLAEFLTCMDGFESKSSDKLVLVIAATNKPWLIDQAVLSRFGKLAYVGLPDKKAREKIFELLLIKKGYKITGTVEQCADKTAGYSGREIEQICKELIRNMISKANPDLLDLVDKGKAALENYTLKMTVISPDDLDNVIAHMPPLTNKNDLTKYEKWQNKSV
ncbi:MAG: ATP-binding protein [Phycisphaerae bacterium]|jgi:SpoVK/Ycf46/Vps4 family AAA+-type ATPase